jgi:ParB family chromosome partitioning protein
MDHVLEIPLEQIQADPDQPRKLFDPTALSELAQSIRANGLLQPITVRRVGDGYWVVAGERRFRAHQINKATTVRAIIIEPAGTADVRIAQIIENDNRVDVTPLEQARSYQSLMDQEGWTAEQLATRIGKAVYRITDRTLLLKLRPEYQDLIASGNLKLTEAYELSRLSPRGQDVLFRAIRTGQCKTPGDLKAAANALFDAEGQGDMMPKPEPVTDEDRRQVRSFEAMVQSMSNLLNASVRDNQITILKKINPDRAGTLADLFAAMQKDLRRIEVALRSAAVQADFLAA